MAPAELEAVISGFDKVADVAVIGIADDRAGELPKVPGSIGLQQNHTMLLSLSSPRHCIFHCTLQSARLLDNVTNY